MQQVQIYRIDELLIRTGFVTLLVVAVVTLAAAPWESRMSLPALLWLCLAAAAPAAMLLAGYGVRRRENRIHAVWRLLQRSLEVDVTALMRASSFTREELVRAVRVLNDRGLGHYVWDDQAEVVRDGRLAVTMAHESRCDTCGAGVSVTLSMSEAPSCPYCEAPLDAGAVNALKQRTIARLDTPLPPDPSVAAPAPRRRMSIGVFVMLLIFCWPAALVYAIYCSR